MNWFKYENKTGIHENPNMDMYLSSLNFTKNSVEYLTHPCEMHDFHLLHDLEKTVEAIKKHIANEDNIVIIGDYDADGVTSTSTLYLTLDFCGACVDYIIPNRVRDGYGLSKNLVDKAIKMNAQVLLTCDNGIAAIEAIQYAKDKGLKVYVTDHHTPGAILPVADTIVHAELGSYPFASISGCQTAYKLCLGILEECSPTKKTKIIRKSLRESERKLKEYLFQLATISIVSDIMPIANSDEELAKVNENRKWLIDGLNSIRNNPDWRIKMMIDMLGLNQKNFDEQSIGFYVGPCLNAVGRLTDADYAVKFLTDETEAEAKKDFSFMMYINDERKQVKANIVSEITLDKTKAANLVVQKDIHEGILGILAGGFANDTGKPSVVLSNAIVDGKKAWKGSGRGNGGINLYDVLDGIQKDTGLIYAFGGHADAAGVTVLDENIEEFKKVFDETMEDTLKHSTVVKNYIKINNRDERLAFTEAVKNLKPFGNGLAQPIVEMSYNISEVDLYHKSNHVKLLQFEVDKSKGKDDFVKVEFWMFGGLEKVQPFCDKEKFYYSDNKDTLRSRGLSKEDVEQQYYEHFKRKRGKENNARITYKIEVGYTDFNGLGPRYNVLEVDY